MSFAQLIKHQSLPDFSSRPLVNASVSHSNHNRLHRAKAFPPSFSACFCTVMRTTRNLNYCPPIDISGIIRFEHSCMEHRSIGINYTLSWFQLMEGVHCHTAVGRVLCHKRNQSLSRPYKWPRSNPNRTTATSLHYNVPTYLLAKAKFKE